MDLVFLDFLVFLDVPFLDFLLFRAQRDLRLPPPDVGAAPAGACAGACAGTCVASVTAPAPAPADKNGISTIYILHYIKKCVG